MLIKKTNAHSTFSSYAKKTPYLHTGVRWREMSKDK